MYAECYFCYSKMASRGKYTKENNEEEEGAAIDVLLESDDDGESGAESFLTDDELVYEKGLDPAEE